MLGRAGDDIEAARQADLDVVTIALDSYCPDAAKSERRQKSSRPAANVHHPRAEGKIEHGIDLFVGHFQVLKGVPYKMTAGFARIVPRGGLHMHELTIPELTPLLTYEVREVADP